MKFINYLETISGISIYPLMSLVLFTTIFTYVLVRVIRADRKTISEIKRIPLD
ncbi:MAG: CcoQ/FixQ family Cbb3-type cytochrome c oxidase assembly chaperone [Flavobacteriales bacterium]|nr:CcoQ/FixQ family Cbb3-type cytochrome c oxidase assembly chaperone [Flavobacteriales bacterium]